MFKSIRTVLQALCIVILAGISLQAETFYGDLYTFTSSAPIPVTSLPGLGTGRVHSLTLTLPAGVCGKVYIGGASMDVSTSVQVGRILFPSGCSSPLEDSWTAIDKLQAGDSIDLTPFYISASPGTQVRWNARRSGISTTYRMLYQFGGAISYSMPLANMYHIEYNVIPGQQGKISINGTTGNLLGSLYPMYYVGGVLTTPFPERFSLDAFGVTNSFNGSIQAVDPIPGELGALFSYALYMNP